MLLKHSMLYLLARGLPGILNFLALAVYTRLLSPEIYGKYALVIAAVGFADAAIFHWLRLGLLRFLPAYHNNREVFLSNVVIGLIGLMVLSGCVAGVALIFTNDPAMRALLALGLGLLWIQALFMLNLELARSQLSPISYGLMTTSKAAVSFAIGSMLAYAGFGAYGLLFGLIIGMLLPVLWQMGREWKGIRFSYVDTQIFRKLLIYGMPLTVTFILGAVISSSDRFILGWYLGADATGLYSVAYDLSTHTISMLMMVVNLAAYPLALYALENKGKDAARHQLSKNATLLMAVSFPAVAGFALLAPNITEVVLGESFQKTSEALIPVIVVASMIAGLKSFYFDLAFQFARYTMGQVWVTLVAALMNILLNFWLIPIYGLMGAAYATLVAYVTALLLSAWFGRKVFILPFPKKDFIKTLAAVTCMIMVLIHFMEFRGGVALVAQVILGMGVYTILLWLLNLGGIRGYLSRIFAGFR